MGSGVKGKGGGRRNPAGPVAVAALLAAGLLLLAGCGEHPALPTSVVTRPEDFGASDTTFLRIGPDWDAAAGYTWTRPGDIQMGRDGLLYIVDNSPVGSHTNGRVVQMSRDGSVLRDDLFAAVADTTRPPRGIGQDSKMNLYMVNGDSVVYAWSQMADHFGVSELVQSMTVIYPSSGEQEVIDLTQPLYTYPDLLDSLAQGAAYVVDMTSTTDPDSLAPYSREYVFYRDSSRPGSEFTDVDGGVDRSGTLFLADQRNDRIISVRVSFSRLLILGDGSAYFTFEGQYLDQVVTFGQGQASTNNPTGLASRSGGTTQEVFFTQTGGNFLVQKVFGGAGTWFFAFTPNEGDPEPQEVLQLGYFSAPTAIAVGESDQLGLGLFYVADSLQNRVAAFYPDGNFFREAAAEEVLVDVGAGDSLGTTLADLGIAFNAGMNPTLEGYVAADSADLAVDSLQSIEEAAGEAGLVFDETLNPDLAGFVAPADTVISLLVPAAKTVKVLLPILSEPMGVATYEGVVYISDTGNDRILRFRRSDSAGNLPNEGEGP